ncbi:MAG: ATP phosphoribosyltransferase [Candidatus Gribaldobacteria bacterium]|nr:ATP phosphoribosyltransferase [Candidatus Gribaldobacteria bacterium]
MFQENLNQKIVFGIPKGSLQENSLLFLRKAGFDVYLAPRVCQPKIDDPEINCFLLRAQEIPKYVSLGKLDAGIAATDWILEQKAKVIEVCDLDFAKKTVGKGPKWVLAVPENSPIKSVKDLQGKVISSEIVETTKDYLQKNGVKAKVEFSWGASEAKVPLFADAVVDITETGESLRANNLKIIDIVLESKTKLIASPEAWKNPWKREKIETMAMLIYGRVQGHQMSSVMAHSSEANLPKILAIIKKYDQPSIKKIAGTDYFDVSFRCKAGQARDLLPVLKMAGAVGIVQSPAFRLG